MPAASNGSPKRHAADLRAHGGAAQAAATRLKARFRELDTNRNGLLDRDELAGLLNKKGSRVSDDEVDKLMRCIDANGSGQVSFSEFVDFIFAGAPPAMVEAEEGHGDDASKEEVVDQRQELVGDQEGLEDLQMDLQPSRRNVSSMGVFGAADELSVNGMYEKGSADWVVADTLGHNRWEGSIMNGHTIFTLSSAEGNKVLFFGTTQTEQKGWFVASSLPAPGEPVEDWLLFNPSPLAETPDQCCATWQTPQGRRPKSVFVEEPKKNEWDVGTGYVGACPAEELWEPLRAEDLAHVFQATDEQGGVDEDFDWECEWAVEAGEFDENAVLGESSDESSDSGGPQQKWSSQEGNQPQAGTGSSMSRAATTRSGHGQPHSQPQGQQGQPLSQTHPAINAATSAPSKKKKKSAGTGQDGGGIAVDSGGTGGGKRKAKKSKPVLVETHTLAPGFKVVRRKNPIDTAEKSPVARKQKGSASFDPEDGKAQAPSAQVRDALGLAEPEAAPVATASRRPSIEENEDYSRYQDGKFVDSAFPPTRKSVGPVSDPDFGFDGWQRLSRLHETPCLVRYVASDSIIGNSWDGNFWFLSALAATAEYPAWVQSMFGKTTCLTTDGMYNVRLYHPGRKEFIRITIDDYVPVVNGAPVFAGISGEGEIWAALVEKACAKLCKSYAAMEWGSMAFGLLYVCGGGRAETWTRMRGPKPKNSRWKRSWTIWQGVSEHQIDRERAEGTQMDGVVHNANQLWATLRRAMELCYPVALDVDPNAPGLPSDRSYSLLGAREVPAKHGQVLRMLYLRNPFGAEEWNGRWSDEDAAWDENPAAKAILDFEETAGGTFWMSYFDFLKFFNQITVVKKSMPAQGCDRTKLVGLKRGLDRLAN